MNKERMSHDKMPPLGSPEFDTYTERAMKLSSSELFDLLISVGIRFPNATREEVELDLKTDLASLLDEANSRRKVDEFLRQKGV